MNTVLSIGQTSDRFFILRLYIKYSSVLIATEMMLQNTLFDL